MPSELDALQATKARYLREIKEAREMIAVCQKEIAEAEAHVRALSEIIAHVGGKPLTEVAIPTTKVTQSGTEAEPPVEQTGWIKEEIAAFVNGKSFDSFSGSDIAREIRSKGHKLTPYQYNSIYATLKRMAVAGDLIQRVPGTAKYERIGAAPAAAPGESALKLAERPPTNDARKPEGENT